MITLILITVPLILLAILITHLNKKAFLNKISKYEVGDIIKFGDKVYDDVDEKSIWKNVKEGTIKKWSSKYFIVISQGKEYYKNWECLKKNISYDDRIAKEFETSIKVECDNYMSENKIKNDVSDLHNEIDF